MPIDSDFVAVSVNLHISRLVSSLVAPEHQIRTMQIPTIFKIEMRKVN